MTSPPVRRPDDLDVVRDSYDRVADNYAHMVTTTGVGDVRTQPWLKATMDVFATPSPGAARSSTSAADPAPSPTTSSNAASTPPESTSHPA